MNHELYVHTRVRVHDNTAGERGVAMIDLSHLSTRERVCIEMALSGLSSTAIANALGIRPSTVRCYFVRAYRKLAVGDLDELMHAAGIAELDPDMKRRLRILAYCAKRGMTLLQAQVVADIVEGLTGVQIAERVAYSIGSVNTARYVAYSMLDVHSRGELLALVRRELGLEGV